MIEELKSQMGKMNAPEFHERKKDSMENLIHEVKLRDEKEQKLFRGMYILFMIMFVLYTLVFVINPDPELTILQRIAGGFFILSFGLMIPFMQQNVFERKGIDYQSSTITFLEKAEGRLRFWNKKSWWILPFLIFICAAENLALYEADWLGFLNPMDRILAINVTYWGLMLIGYFIGRMKWKREKEPLLHRVRDLKMEFSG